MKLLDKLVWKDLIPFFGIGMALFMGIFFAADPVLVASRYLSEGVPLPLVLRVVAVYIPPELALTLPMGVLLAVLQGFGRLSGESEAVALYAAGIPFTRIVVPAAWMGVLISVLGYVINDRVVAAANLEKARLQQNISAYIKNPTPGFATQPLDQNFRATDGTLRAVVHVEGGIDLATKTMRDVTMVFYTQDQPSLLAHSGRGVYLGSALTDYSHWRLFDVDTFTLREGKLPVPGHQPIAGHFDTVTTHELGADFLNQSPEEMALMDRENDTLNFAQKRRKIALMRAAGGSVADLRGAETELWSGIAISFSAFVFALIGAPLGLRPQRSSRTTGWFLAILIIFGYYVLYTATGSAARGGLLPPMLAAFLPNLIGLAIGGVLVWRASR